MGSLLPGAYSAFCKLDENREELFRKVMNGFVGDNHEPFSIATQTVNGTNCAFLCKSTRLRAEESYNSLVIIHEPRPDENAIPTLLDIKTVKII